MAMLDDVKSVLVAAGLGSNIFIGKMPDVLVQATAIYEYPGLAPNFGFNSPGLVDETPNLQVKVKGVAGDHNGPAAHMKAIYRKLAEVQGQTIGGVRYRMIRPKGTCGLIEVDDKNRYTWVANFEVEKEF